MALNSDAVIGREVDGWTDRYLDRWTCDKVTVGKY